MRTAVVETGLNLQKLLQLERGGLFRSFSPGNNPGNEPLLGEFDFKGRLYEPNEGSSKDIDRILHIDQAYACIKILGYRIDHSRGSLVIHYDFLLGHSSIEKQMGTDSRNFCFELRYVKMTYGNMSFEDVVTVDLNLR